MLRRSAVAAALLGCFLAIGAQSVDQYQIPDVPPPGSGSVKCPSIATNSRGDLMIVFRNKLQSIMYYFKKKSTGAVTQTHLPEAKDKDILITSVVATADDNFHAAWGVLITTWPDAVGIGIFYADFDIATEKWSAPVRLEDMYPEDPHLRVNPVTDDIALCTVLRGGGVKNIYVKFRKSGQTAWSEAINLSNMPSGRSATNPYCQFDEDGYLHVVWKEDRGEDDLIIRAALLKRGTDGNYSMVDRQSVSSNYTGWHFLPSVAITGTKGIITFFWKQEAGYYYLPYERSGDKLVFDQKDLTRIVAGPTSPNYMFHSKAINHGDEIMYAYLDMDHKLQLRRWKDGAWLDSTPVTLGDMKINKAPFNLWADPNVGLWSTWYIEDAHGDGHSYYSIYNYPKPAIRPPINVTFFKTMERSMFHGYYLYAVKWENNPYNVEKGITVASFNIYRRVRGSGDKWLRVGSVAGTVFTYGDANGITATSDYEYAVTAVNEKGNESRIEGQETVAVGAGRIIDKKDSER
jgi:hypothetical protein